MGLAYLCLCAIMVWAALTNLKDQSYQLQKTTLLLEECTVRRQHSESINETVAKEYQRLMTTNDILRKRINRKAKVRKPPKRKKSNKKK